MLKEKMRENERVACAMQCFNRDEQVVDVFWRLEMVRWPLDCFVECERGHSQHAMKALQVVLRAGQVKQLLLNIHVYFSPYSEREQFSEFTKINDIIN